MTVELHLPASPSPLQVEELCEVLRRRLSRGDVHVVSCDVRLLLGEVANVEALARVALTARRGGASVRVRGADDAVRSLLVLLGLDEVLPEEPLDASAANGCWHPPPVRTVSGAQPVLPRRCP